DPMTERAREWRELDGPLRGALLRGGQGGCTGGWFRWAVSVGSDEGPTGLAPHAALAKLGLHVLASPWAMTTQSENAPALGAALSAGYRILRRIGSGGTAEVFLTEDRAENGALRAMKLLRSALAEGLVTAMRGEFRILASLDHPGIARVYEFG